MNEFLKLKRGLDKDEGFITLEVIVSILIALAFVAVSMQSLVYAMAIKVQAREKQRANELIQEDIARLNQLGSTPLTPTAATAPVPMCNPVATAADNTTVPPTPAYTEYQNSYASALWNALPAGTQTKNLIEKTESDGSVSVSGRQFALQRFHVSSTARNSVAPHRTLKVGYRVWHWDGTNYTASDGTARTASDQPIAETYVEVIPDVALLCP